MEDNQIAKIECILDNIRHSLNAIEEEMKK